MAKRPKKDDRIPIAPDTLIAVVKGHLQEAATILDPVERAVYQEEFISELGAYDIDSPVRLIRAAEKALGNVSEADREPIEGDPLNPIRALPDNPPMLVVSKALRDVGATLAKSDHDEHKVLAHRATVLQLLKARHISASSLIDRTFSPLLSKARAVPTAEGHSRLTDQAFAEELAAKVGYNLKYRPGIKTGIWYVYESGRWVPSDGGALVPMVQQLARDRYKKAGVASSVDERLRLSKEAQHLESVRVANDIIRMAATLPELRAGNDEFDRDPYLLNCRNGTIDLRTGQLHEHRRDDLLTKMTDVEYDASAACCVFEGFLDRIFDGDRERIAYVQRAAGYTLTGSIEEQVMFLAIGVGANGKTTFLNAVQTAMGPYAVKMSSATLLQQKNGGDSARNDIATIENCRLAACSESGLGRRLNEEWLKELTGGEPIKAKRLYLDMYQIEPTWKIWLCTNHKPVVRGTDYAIWRRLKVIPFNVIIPSEAQDKQLSDKLKTELPGILAWLVRGCLEWRRMGLMEPKAVSDAGTAYREEMDFVAEFIDECCHVAPGTWVSFDTLYQRFTRWAEDNNEPRISKRLLSDRLAEKGFQRQQATTGSRAKGWAGLRLSLHSIEPPTTSDDDGDGDVEIDISAAAEILERNRPPRHLRST